MSRSLQTWIVFAAFAGMPVYAHAQKPAVIEPVPVLIKLYSEADSGCRLAMNDSVQVKVACVSRAIYGAALNDRDWCYGREREANAEMEWHECGADSMRFPALNLPDM
jgi:hypothetical protein